MTYYMNTSVSATTSKAPYEVVFGQAPCTSCAVLEMLPQQGVVNEEDVDDGLIQCDEDQQGEVTVNSSTSEPIQVEMSTPLSEESETFPQKRNCSDNTSEEIDTPNQKIRKVATDNYLKAANKQKVKYDAKRLTKEYCVGDTVGISIHEVDRTNTDARLLPCKYSPQKKNIQQPCTDCILPMGLSKISFLLLT